MDKDQFEGKWHEYKGKIKEKWGKLTDDDFMEIRGKKEALVGKIQSHYGYAKEKIEKELAELCGCRQNQHGDEHGQSCCGQKPCGQKPCGCKGPCDCKKDQYGHGDNQHGHDHGHCEKKPCGCKGPCNCKGNQHGHGDNQHGHGDNQQRDED